MYPLRYHPGLETRWKNFPTHQQLIMISNELGRAQKLIAAKKWASVHEAYKRAFELCDLTVEYSNENFRHELLRWREVLASLYIQPLPSAKTNAQLLKVLLAMHPESWKSWKEIPI